MNVLAFETCWAKTKASDVSYSIFIQLIQNLPQLTKRATASLIKVKWRNAVLHVVQVSWNVMAHTQKLDFFFRRNGRVHLNRQGASVRSTTGSRGVRISGSNTGYTMFRGSVKGTGYPLHSPVSPSLPVNVCHHISTGLYRCVLVVT